jgi:hypothetical protein
LSNNDDGVSQQSVATDTFRPSLARADFMSSFRILSHPSPSTLSRASSFSTTSSFLSAEKAENVEKTREMLQLFQLSQILNDYPSRRLVTNCGILQHSVGDAACVALLSET